MTPATETIAAIRFGCGLPLQAGAPRDAKAMIAALSGPDLMAQAYPLAGQEALAPLQFAFAETKKVRGAGREKAMNDARAQIVAVSEQAVRGTLARAVAAADGFRERLAAFWADHFTVIAPNLSEAAIPQALIEDAIRPHLAGHFPDMLIAVSLHPSMLTYLDQAVSVGPNSQRGQRKEAGLNENLARELLELHTLGVGGGYAQADVRELAELLTGLTWDPRRGFEYDKRRAEPGAETVLGTTYAGEKVATIRQALSDIALRPETAAHLARKLAVHFVADQPDPAMVEAMAGAYTASGGNLVQVYAAMLDHPAAWTGPLTKARQPLDLTIAALRALGVTADQIMAMPAGRLRKLVVGHLAAMGQPFRRPRGPDGWAEEEEAWITPSGLAARVTWAMTVPQQLLRELPDPVEFARLALGDRASEALLWAAARAEKRSEGVGIVLASAEFNRR